MNQKEKKNLVRAQIADKSINNYSIKSAGDSNQFEADTTLNSELDNNYVENTVFDESFSLITEETPSFQKRLMDTQAIRRSLVRISHEILETNRGVDNLVLLGLANGGVEISATIGKLISDIEKIEIPNFILNASKHRDDFGIRAEKDVLGSTISIGLENKHVVLVDDVLYTGRTVRAAFQALLEYGRPDFVKLAVLIDRGHREFPIRPDFVGKNIPTSLTEKVTVKDTGVWLEKYEA